MSHDDEGLPYGVDAKGRMVAVAEVARGLACNCRCPACDSRLIARQGDIRSWHFAHESAATCAGGFESMTHKLAKQIIADHSTICIPALVGFHEGAPALTIEAARDMVLTDLRLEHWLGGIRPDVIGSMPDGSALVIEIYWRHQCEAAKLEQLRERNIAAFELDLSGYDREVPYPVLAELVLHQKSQRHWLHHPRQAEADAAATAHVIAACEAMARREAEREERTRRWNAAEAERRRRDEQQQQAYRARLEVERAEAAKAAARQGLAGQAEELEAMRQPATIDSRDRIAFLRGLPRMAMPLAVRPRCECHTPFLWREGISHAWRCFTCDSPRRPVTAQYVRAEVAA